MDFELIGRKFKICALITLGGTLGVWAMSPDGAFWLLVFNLSVLLLGMPHGFSDARLIWGHRQAWFWLAIYLLSAATALLFLELGWLGPLFFLLLTAWHWGTNDLDRRGLGWRAHSLMGSCRGLVLIAGVFAFRPEASWDFISLLDPNPMPEQLQTLAMVTASISGLIWGIGEILLRKPKQWKRFFGEFTLLVLLISALPPLGAITSYYLCWHCVRHFLLLEWSLPQVAKIHLWNALLIALPFFVIATTCGSAALAGAAVSSLHLKVLFAFSPVHAALSWFRLRRNPASPELFPKHHKTVDFRRI